MWVWIAQVLPPSLVAQSSPLSTSPVLQSTESTPKYGTPSLVSMSAYTRRESDLLMQSAILPTSLIGSPLPSSSVQVSPPSRVM